MHQLVQLLVDQPLLLLFVVAAIGYPLGRLPLKRSSLGIAAVLFVGLAVGALDPRLELPEFAYVFGLVLFVYSVGLTSAAGFRSAFERRALRELGLVAGVLVGATLLTGVLARALSLGATEAAGLFAGSLTNTPALAAVLERARALGSGASDATAAAIIGYSLTYPIGVLGVLATLALAKRVWRVNSEDERARLASVGIQTADVVARSVRIRVRPGSAAVVNLETLRHDRHWPVVFGRVRTSTGTQVVDARTEVRDGDIVTVVGVPVAIARVVDELGVESAEAIERDRAALDYRRVFVSNADVVGRRLGHLGLPARFGAVVTRVRRGDVDMVADDEMVLELGDRVRVLADRTRLDAVSAFFGDSYRALSELDILAFSVGPALGLLLGLLPIPLPGGIDIRLGIAGGPLIVALGLGLLGRTGPIVWGLPYSANLTLRQIGLVLFLAAIGTRAGWEFRTLLTTGGGLAVVAAGALLTTLAAFITLWFAYRVLRMPFALASGLLAAVQTQPAVLGFAVEQDGSDLPNLAYARIYPFALVAKIVLAQLLVEWLR